MHFEQLHWQGCQAKDCVRNEPNKRVKRADRLPVRLQTNLRKQLALFIHQGPGGLLARHLVLVLQQRSFATAFPHCKCGQRPLLIINQLPQRSLRASYTPAYSTVSTNNSGTMCAVHATTQMALPGAAKAVVAICIRATIVATTSWYG